MWKKILSSIFFGSFIVATCSNVVSCNVIKQKQLSFNLKDWQNSWAFNTQSIWQALGYKKDGVILEESKGLFLSLKGDDKVENKNINQLFAAFDQHGITKSDRNYLETYLQLQYFIPSIIYYNEKPYESPLIDWESINRNFEFSYESTATTKIEEKLNQESGMPEDQWGPVCELVWATNQAGETLNAYFELTISLKNPKVIDDKWVSVDGYYVETAKGSEKEITWTMGVYFSLPLL